MLYQPNERILPWIQTKDHLVLHTFCCFLQLYNELLHNGTKGWNKKTTIISPEIMTLTPLTLDGFFRICCSFSYPTKSRWEGLGALHATLRNKNRMLTSFYNNIEAKFLTILSICKNVFLSFSTYRDPSKLSA